MHCMYNVCTVDLQIKYKSEGNDMNATSYPTDGQLVSAFRAAAEAFLAALDRPPTTHTRTDETAPIEYDPLHDDPPILPNPMQGAPAAQRQMAWITYLGGIGRINADERRGANGKEVSALAKKAGYSGGNAVNGWNSREGSPRAVEIEGGARFLNDETLAWIENEAAELGINLVGDYATVPKYT